MAFTRITKDNLPSLIEDKYHILIAGIWSWNSWGKLDYWDTATIDIDGSMHSERGHAPNGWQTGWEKDKEFRKVLTWKKFRHKLDYLETVSDEVELLQRFRQIILDYQPDILTGYFSDGFDLPYLHLRAEKYKIKLDLGLDYSELETGSKSDFREGKSRITGILHLDNLKFIRNIFGKNLKTESYSLDAVSEELLGHRKHQVKISELPHT